MSELMKICEDIEKVFKENNWSWVYGIPDKVQIYDMILNLQDSLDEETDMVSSGRITLIKSEDGYSICLDFGDFIGGEFVRSFSDE